MRVVVRLASLVVVLAVLVLGVTAGRVWAAGRGGYVPRADAVVVLGAAQYDGRPQGYLVARLEHARALYDQGVAARILTLGGKRPGDRFTEADAGQSWLLGHGVPSGSVVRVGAGSDTLQSVRAAAAVMKQRGWGSAAVVTDPWHELRSTSMLADAGIIAHPSPTTSGPSVAGAGVEARYVARETIAYLAYELGHELGRLRS